MNTIEEKKEKIRKYLKEISESRLEIALLSLDWLSDSNIDLCCNVDNHARMKARDILNEFNWID